MTGGEDSVTADFKYENINGGGRKKKLKGRGAHEGGKRKCPIHCRRHTRRTRRALRKSLKHHKKSMKHHKKSKKHHKKSMKRKSRKGGTNYIPLSNPQGTLELHCGSVIESSWPEQQKVIQFIDSY